LIYDLYGGMCVFCPPEKGVLEEWHCDHFDPWSKSQDSGLGNLVVTCEAHNQAKSDSDPKAWLRLMKTVHYAQYVKFCGLNGIVVPAPMMAAPVPQALVTFKWREKIFDWRSYPRMRWRCPNEETKCWELYRGEYNNQVSKCPDCWEERPYLTSTNIRLGLVWDDLRRRGVGTKAELWKPRPWESPGKVVSEYDPSRQRMEPTPASPS
jgi:hypothetical protein